MAKAIPVEDLPIFTLSMTKGDLSTQLVTEGGNGVQPQPAWVFLFDKPKGWSSFKAVKVIRRLTGIKKVGHAGTLDPMATGLLVICTGKATKSISQIQDGEKEYLAEVTLGASTASYDAETDVDETADWDHIARGMVEKTIEEQFLGPIEQVPPVYSALKLDGQPLYKMARKGRAGEIAEQVQAKKRIVEILDNEILSFEPPMLNLRIQCSKGTYIRSIAHDLGIALGSRAHLSGLRRTRIGRFDVKDALTVEQLETALG